MIFEYDSNKSINNKKKHGIDFIQAQQLWNDKKLLVAPLIYVNEPRWIAIGLIKTKHYSAIFTYRGINIRIISVRRSRVEEVTAYERN